MAWAEKALRSGAGWRGRYRDSRGRTRTAGYGQTAREAIKLARDQEAKLRDGAWVDPHAGRISFSEYFETQWLPNRVAERTTLATYESHYNAALKPEFGAMQLRRILPTTVQGWVKRMQEHGVSPVTIRARHKALQTVLAAKKGGSALQDKLIVANPCAATLLPTVPDREVQIYTPDEVDALIAALDPWWLPLVLLDVDTGMRWGELMGLQVEDFTLGYKSVHVRRTIGELTIARTGNGTRFYSKDYPKGRKQRHLALSPEVSTQVEQIVRDRGLTLGDRLFAMPDRSLPRAWRPPMSLEWTPMRTEQWPQGLPISRNHFRDSVWLKAISEAGVPHRRFHDLRATNISWLLSATQNVSMVMERVGHTEFETTRRYTKALLEADTEAVEALRAVRQRFSRA